MEILPYNIEQDFFLHLPVKKLFKNVDIWKLFLILCIHITQYDYETTFFIFTADSIYADRYFSCNGTK